MYLGRVVGCVWATIKNRSLSGQRMLVVQPLTPELNPTGKRLVCTDWTGAGAGEIVYWCRGKEASFPFLPSEVATDTNIVGIVDSVTVDRKAKSEAEPAAPPQPDVPSGLPLAHARGSAAPISSRDRQGAIANPRAGRRGGRKS